MDGDPPQLGTQLGEEGYERGGMKKQYPIQQHRHRQTERNATKEEGLEGEEMMEVSRSLEASWRKGRHELADSQQPSPISRDRTFGQSGLHIMHL